MRSKTVRSKTTREPDARYQLDDDGHLMSDLWLDQIDAHDRIDARLAAGSVSSTDAERLHDFVDRGYLRLNIDFDDAAAARFDAELDRLWEQRPADLAISPLGKGAPMSFADYEGEARDLGARIPDLHGYSEPAMDLYLHADIFRFVELIFDQPAISFQSLYFPYGSAQAMHRDPMFVATNPTAHLAASWIALEDITADSGPLAYVPGSHRLPWFEFEENSLALTPTVPDERRVEYSMWSQRNIKERGLQAQSFTCKRGDVFIWHGGLVHGGSKIDNPEQTRKSFVVHYSTAATYQSRSARMRVRHGDQWRSERGFTDTIVTAPGARGLDSPMKGR